MNPDLEKLFDQAVSLNGTEREEFIAGNCPDPGLRRELEKLLASDPGASTFLQDTVLDAASSALQDLTFSHGQRLGPYRVLSVIGRGGMGLVYLAERADGKFEQRVALKVLQSGPDQPFVADQLQRECRILASLEHPNIARVLDADATENGVPYFVMEYVNGQPIDRYCDNRKLSFRDRLRVLLPVFDAVQVAHQKLIVHRDLKPDNILVTTQGVPKLLDFGIAKSLTDTSSAARMTSTRVLTPEYASPEQVRGEALSTATDVYSLGAILYKLLTGVAPHPVEGKSAAQVVHAICEEDIRKPSERRRELSGDLEHILEMALRKEPVRRYRSVDQFAADIENFLEQKPVIARRDTPWYRSSKYVRRHALAVGFATAIVVLLCVFSLLQARQLRKTTEERDRATRITDFMTAMFKVSDPSQARGNTITAREILDKASKDIDKGMAQDPVQQAQMMHVMGTVYFGLGLTEEAESLWRKAFDIRRRTLGSDNPETVETMIQLSFVTDRAEGEQLLRDAVEIRHRTLGPHNPDTLVPMSLLSGHLAMQGRLSEADQLARQVMDIRSRVHVPDSEAIMDSLEYLGGVFMREGKYSQADQLDRQILDFRRRRLDTDHPDVLSAESSLAWALWGEGRWSEAELLLRQAVETGRRVLGPDHFSQTNREYTLAEVLADEGRYDEAERLHRKVLEARRRTAGPSSAPAVNSMNSLAQILINDGRYSEADKLLWEAAEISVRQSGRKRPLHLIAIAELGVALDDEGRHYEAEKLERESFDGMSQTLGPEQPDTLKTSLSLAIILMHEGRNEEAGKLAQNVRETNRHVRGDRDPITAAATYTLACINAQQANLNDSFSLLQQSIDNGLAPNHLLQIEQTPDLKPLHGDPRWNGLALEAKEHAAAIVKPQ